MSDLKKDFVIATDYVVADGKTDVSDALQKLIDENPNRQIYFPDGTYLISKPICTSADIKKSVSLELSTFAIIKATDDWDSDEAMIRLGGKDQMVGSSWDIGLNYCLSGGIIDGSGKANGVSIDSGNETCIKYVNIKNTRIGLHLKRFPTYASTDADIFNVNITGTGTPDSIGLLVDSLDNTFTNMRIANVFIGVRLRGQGNFLKNVHPLYTSDYTDYENSCGFYDTDGNNWFDNCYSDHFGVGFRLSEDRTGIFTNCFVYWYNNQGKKHTAFKTEGTFDCSVKDMRIGFYNGETINTVLDEGKPGGKGVFERLFIETDETQLNETTRAFEKFLEGNIIVSP